MLVAAAVGIAPARADDVAGPADAAHASGRAGDGPVGASPVVVAPLPARQWVVRLPAGADIPYRGTVDFDDAGLGTGAILYPAPNVIGFIAAVVTHGIILESAKQRQKEQIERAANAVLGPHKEVLAQFKSPELFERALSKTRIASSAQLVGADAATADAWTIVALPVFAMTQDRRALVVDNVVSIFAPGQPTAPQHRNVIRVVSARVTDRDALAHWSADHGERLKRVSAELLAESLDVALWSVDAPRAKPDAEFKTVRYFEGATEKFERAERLLERCNRLLLRNLRGWMMVVPVKPAAGAADEMEPPTRGSECNW